MALEQIKFKENKYDLVPAGLSGYGDKITFIFLPGNKSYEEIEQDLTGCNRIETYDCLGELVQIQNEYIYLDSLTKQNDYLLSITSETGEVEESLETVMIATLKKADLRVQVNEMQEVVDSLLLSSLEE